MLRNIWVVSALCAVALSAPALNFPGGVEGPGEIKILTDYFQMLAQKVQEGKNMAQAPVCDVSKAVMPVASPTPLAAPSAGLVLKHVAVGRGTQNYTCGTNETAAPTAVGAVATLYNATCLASTYPDLLERVPNVALQFNLTDSQRSTLAPSNLVVSGHHYFTNTTTPFFDLDSSAIKIGTAPCSKLAAVPAPPTASKGQYNKGDGAVPWLKLVARDGATGNLEEVYRVNTAGGNPPATCAGMPAAFEVQYAAEYWFYSKPISP